jgi:riboflavin kinase / FMN adenylyltransferase
MEIIDWHIFHSQDRTEDMEVSASIGVFDGVHIGHRELIQRILANPLGSIPMIITFKQNPASVIHPDRYQGDITTLEQKLERFERLEVGAVILIDFSSEFSKLSGKEFLEILRRRLRLKQVVIGKNFHCGYKMDTDAEAVKRFLESFNIRVDVVHPVMERDHPVSSTRIRRKIKAGNIAKAEQLLMNEYSIDVRQCNTELEESNYRIQKKVISQVLPDPGRYSVALEYDKRRCLTDLIISESIISWPKNTEFIRVDYIHFLVEM